MSKDSYLTGTWLQKLAEIESPDDLQVFAYIQVMDTSL
jgi:hypothetical protein